MLSRHGFSPTSVDTIGFWLSKYYQIVRCSDKRSQVLRLLDMIFTFIVNVKKVKVVLIDTYSSKGFIYAYIISKLCILFRVPYIPILHGGELPVLFDKKTRISYNFIRRAQDVVSPSLFLKNDLIRRGWRECRYIPNAIVIDDYDFSDYLLPTPKIFWLRSFHKIYNPSMAIEVLLKLLKFYPSAELCMVGPDKDGSMNDIRAAIRKNALEGSIKLTGKLSKKEWIELSKNYSFFINTTNVDNAPVSVIEAMALGLTVVSTNVGGLPFLLKDGEDSLLVAPEDADSMGNYIVELLNNPERNSKLRLKAREKSLQYDFKLVLEKWNLLLDQFVEKISRVPD
jgi:glycosyltransferase involved in cell wall biosynthesis